MTESYSSELAIEILDILHQKGWNAYRSDDLAVAEDVIRQNLADSLEVGGKYILLPAVDDPRNPEKVLAALDRVAQKLDRKMPTITIGNVIYPIKGLEIMSIGVNIYTPKLECGTYYYIFKVDLSKSLTQIKE
jgi:hypothetical protein